MGRTAIVVGGTRRVGRWVSEALLIEGFEVHAVYRQDDDAAERVRSELGAAGHTLHTHRADAADELAIADALQRIAGEGRDLSILVNCCGPAAQGQLLDTSSAHAESLWRGNVLAVHNAVRAAVPLMASDGGRVINFLSIGGDTARAFRQVPLYAAAKAMLASYSRSLARELAPHGVTVNCIALGATSLSPENVPAVPADSLPSGKYVVQEDVAAAIWYLIGPASAQTTGSVLNLSGGWAL